MKTLPLILALLLLQEKPREIKSPLAPEEALAEFRIDPGLRVELVASEPQIQSPVAAAFDENGRLYVVEMIDYPVAEPGKPPQGRIKLLEDRDGDGRYETATVFADGLLMANGVLPWRGGAICTCAPHILFLKDTDGDGKADLHEPLFEGFAVQNPQLRVSFPTLGIDGWIYVANGARGGKIRPAGRPAAPDVDIGGMDFRFDPIHVLHEPVSGFGQFGLTFDDWGRRFVCTNRNHVIPMVMPNRYFARNPYLAFVAPRTDNQGAGGAARVYPISKNKTLAASHAGTFTAACGITAYRGNLLPAGYRGSVFTCEPTGNLVHQEILTPRGATFDYKPPQEGREFLASPDNWFRPVSMFHGPDGALYVVDFYRAEVEHPDWVPADLRHRYDWNARKDMGRIWRIVPEQHHAPFPKPRLSQSKTADLVALLDHPDGWWRMTAHRLLLERQDREAWGPLRQMAASGSPAGRLHAAWVLEGIRSLDVDLAVRLMLDPHPRVRENAVRLAERWASSSSMVQDRLVALADDPDGQVRFQVALSIGEWDSEAILEPLARIAKADIEDRWTRLAVASAVPNRAASLLEKIESPLMARELATIVGSWAVTHGDSYPIARVLSSIEKVEPRRQAPVLNGLADGVGRRGTSLVVLLQSFHAPLRIQELARTLLAGASASAVDAARPMPERLDAVRLMVHVPWEAAMPNLEKLVAEDQPQDIRIAAVAALSAHKRPEVSEILMKSWKTYMPAMRREVLEAMSRQPERLDILLKEVEGGRLAGGELGPNLIKQLVNHGNAALRDRAKKVLQVPEGRQKIIQQYKPAVAMAGDAKKGREVFQKTCASCHRVAGIGTNVGPDISDALSKSKEQLLTDILDPSAAIDNNYVNYIVKTKGGAVLTGFIAAQTASSLTLRRGENQEDVVLKQDIEEMKSSGVSLMPEGVEKTVSVEAMADLLAFLKNWRDLDAAPPERK